MYSLLWFIKLFVNKVPTGDIGDDILEQLTSLPENKQKRA
nr:MAG TPA: hypothetical protein [Caudoviricetes sp.]